METADSWIRDYHPSPGGAARLVCLPHAGGSATNYFAMAKALAPAVEVLAVQYPGRQDRRSEPFAGSVEELADGVTAALARWADRPLALFGHSMGATVAFEVARRMERPPVHLFVSGRRSPTRPRHTTIHTLSDDLLVAEMSRLGGTDPRVLADPEVLAMTLPVVRNDYRAVESYRYVPAAKLTCPITALVGDQDTQVTVEEASAWRELSTGPFELRVFPGGHFYLEAHHDAVCDLISVSLSLADLPMGAADALPDTGTSAGK